MKKIVINGNRPLTGTVKISGAKNSVVALIPAALLAESPVILEEVPDIEDVHALIAILTEMGARVDYDAEQATLFIDPTSLVSVPLPTGKINSFRASYYFMGALLGRFHQAVVGLPGGCNLGARPIDLHIKGFESLGATVTLQHGATYLKAENGLSGARIFLDTVSIGATINILLAAVKAEGKTVIENAAREPEIVDLANLLNQMGANIKGAGTNEIRIEGVKHLRGVRYAVVPDRIEAGTYLTIAAACGGFEGVTITNVIPEHLEGFIAKLQEMGVEMTIDEDQIHVHPCLHPLKPIHVQTCPYPGFATDLQQPLTPLLFKTEGENRIVDTIYPKRVNHVPELVRMGGNARIEGNMIFIEPSHLKGTEVCASDLRAGACLVCAGLMAEGKTVIDNIYHILRGYDHIVEKLSALGADIEMIELDEVEETA